MVMCPAPIAQVANLQSDVLSGERAPLMHVFLFEGRALLLLFQLCYQHVFRPEVVLDLPWEIPLPDELPLGRIVVVLAHAGVHLLQSLNVRPHVRQAVRAGLLNLIELSLLIAILRNYFIQ